MTSPPTDAPSALPPAPAAEASWLAFEEAVAALGLSFPLATVQPQLQQFYTRLEAAPFNVTRLHGWDDFLLRHVLDSLTLLPWLPESGKFVDLGSGGGFPLVPLLLARPGLHAFAIEATQKKAAFLLGNLATLGLDTHATVLAERAEILAQRPAHRGRYPWLTARAVAPLARLLPWATPLLAPGGQLLAMKGKQASAELATAPLAQLGLRLLGMETFAHVPALRDAVLLRFEKIAPGA
jgi:16S rRNA (guanine527-N7)-methyltransferase